MRRSVSVSSGGSIGVCWSKLSSTWPKQPASFSILGWIDWCLLDRLRRDMDNRGGQFQYPRVDRLVSAGAGIMHEVVGLRAFQYPRVDRLVSAGGQMVTVQRHPQRFSILGWIDWCLLDRVRLCVAPGLCCFSILGWIDWCLLAKTDNLPASPAAVFQYPRVDRLVSAGGFMCALRAVIAGMFQYPRVDRLVSAG